MHALIRTQHVDNISGGTFTGGLDEALFTLQIGVIMNPDYRIGSPAAGLFTAPHCISESYFSRSFDLLDGPPFRALYLIEYAEWLLQPEQNKGTWVADVLWPAIDLDLHWISSHWNQSSYV